MITQKLLAVLTIASALALPSAAMAGIVLNGNEYPEWKRAELRAACQGLEGQSKESLTAIDKLDEESGDPASDFRLSTVPFTLRDCQEAGLI
jgi:hypothetical protein